MKTTNYTEMNHVMVYFSGHRNTIFIDSFLQPQKWSVLWYFNNSFSYKPIVSSMHKVTLQIKNEKDNHSFTSHSLEHTKSYSKKKHSLPVYKNCTLNENIKISLLYTKNFIQKFQTRI